jgi:hypothetical protein
MPFKKGGWARGTYRCDAPGCTNAAEISVSTQLSTPGGRAGRVQVRTRSVRLCESCLAKHISELQPTMMRKMMLEATGKLTANRGPK